MNEKRIKQIVANNYKNWSIYEFVLQNSNDYIIIISEKIYRQLSCDKVEDFLNNVSELYDLIKKFKTQYLIALIIKNFE